MVASGLSFAKDTSSETQFEIAPDVRVHQVADCARLEIAPGRADIVDCLHEDALSPAH